MVNDEAWSELEWQEAAEYWDSESPRGKVQMALDERKRYHTNSSNLRTGVQVMTTQPEYEAFGWSILDKSSLPMSETCGLDYESAVDATPRWYCVSSGNGNDGVSHIWPDYYVRCSEEQAWELARAAMIASFEPAGYAWAVENMTVDGEADCTITAMITNPPDDDPNPDDDEDGVDGAWLIVEVFPADDEYGLPADPADVCGLAVGEPVRPAYLSLVECFDANVLALAQED